MIFCIENSDAVIIINREKKVDTGEVFMTFKLLKRRYRSAEDDRNLRELEYFNHPYQEGSSIKLVDDIYMDTSVSLTSLAASFVAADNPAVARRGKTNVVDREEKKKENKEEADILAFAEFEPFSFAG